MAMTAGAPMNDWGTVGIWPGVRIVSIRARPIGRPLSFESYQRAISECEKRAGTYGWVAAVNLSMGCGCAYSDAEIARLENRIADAHQRFNVSVIASAGNSAASIGMPAAASGVLSVGASDHVSGLCSYSNRGPEP